MEPNNDIGSAEELSRREIMVNRLLEAHSVPTDMNTIVVLLKIAIERFVHLHGPSALPNATAIFIEMWRASEVAAVISSLKDSILRSFLEKMKGEN